MSHRLLALCLLAALPRVAAAQTTAYAFMPGLFSGQTRPVDVASGVVLPALTTPVNGVSVAASPDGRIAYLASQSFASLTVIDVATLTVTGTVPLPCSPFATTFTSDGTRAYVTCQFGDRVVVVDVAAGAATGTIVTPSGSSPRMIAVTPDGQRAFFSGASSLYSIDLATNTMGPSVSVGATATGLQITPDGQRAFVVARNTNVVAVVDLATVTVTQSITVGALPLDLAMSRDGLRAYVTNNGGDTVSVIDVVGQTVLTTIPVGDGPAGVSFTPDGRQVYVINRDAQTLSVLDVATNTVTATLAALDSLGYGAQFMTPALVVPGGGPLTISGDTALDTAGFRRFVPFLGGTLRLAAPWTTTRRLSLLAPGGTLDTNGFDASIVSNAVGAGTLTKIGAGALRFAGTIGSLQVSAGTLAPGDGVGVLTAGQVTLAVGATLAIDLSGTVAGTGYDQLLTSGTAALNGATLVVTPSVQHTPGTTFTIVTNATGTFAGLAEGATVPSVRGRFRVSYVGGDGNDVVLTKVNDAPTIAPIGPQSVPENLPLTSLPVTVSDVDDAIAALVVTATSSDQAIVPDTGILVQGSSMVRFLSAAPRPGVRGTVTITVTVADGLSSTTTTFPLSVTGGTYYLAEGATGDFFDTDILLANPGTVDAPLTIRFLTGAGAPIVQTRTLPALSRQTIRADAVAGLESTTFSTIVTSNTGAPIVVERTMRWGVDGYGAHTEKATGGAGLDWYFAEGSQGYFTTYLLLSNPQATPNVAHVTYYREGLPPLTRDVVLPILSRVTVDISSDVELRDRSFGMRVTFDLPGAADRAMYFGGPPFWSGGTTAAGIAAPSPTWFFAEGATGSYFATFLLLANPNSSPADVTLTYYPSTGVPVTRTATIPAGERLTRNIALEDPALASAAVATRVTATLPVVAERAQYWGAPAWVDGHASAGVAAAGLRWGLAEGRVGGADEAQTYVLLANPGATAATVTVTFLRESGATIVKTFTVAPTSRFNVAVAGAGSQVPELANERFGAAIASTQPIVVERSLYTNAGGVTWAAGTNATATPLP